MPTSTEINGADLPLTTAEGYVIIIVGGAGKRFDTKSWSRRRVASFVSVTGTTYNVVATDDGKFLIHSNSAASTITVLNDSSLVVPVGSIIEIQRAGSGSLTIAAGSGVTLTTAGRPKLRAQGSVARLIKTAANSWTLEGDTSA